MPQAWQATNITDVAIPNQRHTAGTAGEVRFTDLGVIYNADAPPESGAERGPYVSLFIRTQVFNSVSGITIVVGTSGHGGAGGLRAQVNYSDAASPQELFRRATSARDRPWTGHGFVHNEVDWFIVELDNGTTLDLTTKGSTVPTAAIATSVDTTPLERFTLTRTTGVTPSTITVWYDAAAA